MALTPDESMPLTFFALAIGMIAVMAFGASKLHEHSRALGYQQCVAEQDDDK